MSADGKEVLEIVATLANLPPDEKRPKGNIQWSPENGVTFEARLYDHLFLVPQVSVCVRMRVRAPARACVCVCGHRFLVPQVMSQLNKPTFSPLPSPHPLAPLFKYTHDVLSCFYSRSMTKSGRSSLTTSPRLSSPPPWSTPLSWTRTASCLSTR